MKEENTFELVGMLFKIFRLMKEEMSYTNNLTHLSLLQIQTLIFLHKNKKTSMSGIAEYFGIELPSATSLITKLCDQKLVQRSDDPGDRRLVRITLTDEGKTLLEQAIHERKKKIEKILSYLSPKEKSELLTILQTLNNRLQK
jgi:MarR family transcriptional regulator, organic hydroperoxide resistance regulator